MFKSQSPEGSSRHFNVVVKALGELYAEYVSIARRLFSSFQQKRQLLDKLKTLQQVSIARRLFSSFQLPNGSQYDDKRTVSQSPRRLFSSFQRNGGAASDGLVTKCLNRPKALLVISTSKYFRLCRFLGLKSQSPEGSSRHFNTFHADPREDARQMSQSPEGSSRHFNSLTFQQGVGLWRVSIARRLFSSFQRK